MALYRQGDILFIRVAALPQKACVKRDNVVAEGELTGHLHRLEGAAELLEEIGTGTLYVNAAGEGRVTHDEHAPLALPAGAYEVRRQREYAGEGERAYRVVAD